MTHWTRSIATAALMMALGGVAMAQQGITKDEIRLSTIQDISGPIAAFGKQVRNGMQMKVDEINAAGGIHGRKIKFFVEDSGYDPKKAVLAAQKAVNQDKVFAVVGQIGTAPNMASMPVQFAKNVINWFPITAAREMYEPHHRLKFSNAATYYDMMRLGLPQMLKKHPSKSVCIIYQDDEFGLEVLRGTEEALKGTGQTLVEKTSYKRGATDFSSQVAKMKAANCDFVVLGTVLRETIGTVGEARKVGFNPTFFASGAAYTELIHKLGGKAMDGIYAAMTVEVPYLDDQTEPKLREWAERYKKQFGEDPTVFSAYGYINIDTFEKAAQKTGPDLNVDTFVKTMENNMRFERDVFGMPTLTFSATKRLGNEHSRISQIQDGRWKVVVDYNYK